MKKSVLLSIAFTGLLVCLSSGVNAQGVGINSSGNPPDPSAILDASSTTKGTLITRMSTAQRDSITLPAEGLMIFNTTTKCFEAYVGNMWGTISCPCPLPAAPTAGTHTAQPTQITWNWNTVSGATGYKYNTVNDYSTATNNGANTGYTQTGLTCNTAYTLYIWAYSPCGNSSFITLNQTTSSCPWTCGSILTDSRDAKTYSTVLIGTQCWMAQNLAYLPTVSPASSGSSSVAYYYVYGYNGTDVPTAKATSNYINHGVLYNWSALMNGSSASTSVPSGVQGICPVGWHVPSDGDWCILEDAVEPGGADWCNTSGVRGSQVGNRLKASGSNSSGFTGLLSGNRTSAGAFELFGSYGYFWSTDDSVWMRLLYSGSNGDYRIGNPKDRGFTVRCIKD